MHVDSKCHIQVPQDDDFCPCIIRRQMSRKENRPKSFILVAIPLIGTGAPPPPQCGLPAHTLKSALKVGRRLVRRLSQCGAELHSQNP